MKNNNSTLQIKTMLFFSLYSKKSTTHIMRFDSIMDDVMVPFCQLMRYNQANTKHLYSICKMLGQRRRRWTDVVQMLYKCFVFAGYIPKNRGYCCSFNRGLRRQVSGRGEPPGEHALHLFVPSDAEHLLFSFVSD